MTFIALTPPMYVNALQYGAKGDGTTDDTTAIQAALNACPSGGVVIAPASGNPYRTSAPLVIPPNVSLWGTHGNRAILSTGIACLTSIKPLASFSGAAAITLLDKEQGSYSADSGGQRIKNISLDGSALAGTIDGIKATGLVHDVMLENVAINSFPHNGLTTTSYTRLDTSVVHPYSWTLINCMAYQNANIGYSLNGLTDSELISVEALGNSNDGFFLATMANSHLVSCRAEFSGNYGFHITGGWGTGIGSGGCTMAGCSTDRSTKDGVYIDATGNGQITINGLMTRRDGANSGSGGGGYAGLTINGATMPVIVNGHVNYPGVADDGTGTNSPQYGFSSTGASYVRVNSAYLHANTAGWHDGGSNTVFIRGSVAEATGSTSSPANKTVNAIGFTDATTGNNPTIAANGSDTDIGINLVPKGAGSVQIGGVTVPTISSNSTLTNKTMSGASNTFSNIPESSVTSLTTDLSSRQLITKIPLATPSGGSQQYGIPGALFNSVGTTALNANEVRYVPMVVLYSVTLSAWELEVTTGPGGSANLRVGIYAADNNMQPTGAPLYDSGSVAVASSFTGLKSASGLSIALTPGVYLVCINTDTAMTLRTFISGSSMIGASLGATPMIQRVTASQTYGALPNPGTAWTSTNASSGGLQHFAVWQWS